jgi:hypothetical protein
MHEVFYKVVLQMLEYLVVIATPETPLIGKVYCFGTYANAVSFWLKMLFRKLINFNPNETPGWNGFAWFMLSGYSGPHDSCLVLVMWLSLPEGALVDGHPGLKRLICLPCLSVLPVQP